MCEGIDYNFQYTCIQKKFLYWMKQFAMSTFFILFFFLFMTYQLVVAFRLKCCNQQTVLLYMKVRHIRWLQNDNKNIMYY